MDIPATVQEDGTISFNGDEHHQRQRTTSRDVELMGPILRRRKVVSMPLGADPAHAQFFYGERNDETETTTRPRRIRQVSEGVVRFDAHEEEQRIHKRQVTPPSPGTKRNKQRSGGGILRRKMVSLDVLAPEAAEFFGEPVEVMEPLLEPEPIPEKSEEEILEEGKKEDKTKKLFWPLVFAPAVRPVTQEALQEMELRKQEEENKEVFNIISTIKESLTKSGGNASVLEKLTNLQGRYQPVAQDETGDEIPSDKDEFQENEVITPHFDSSIKRAKRKDYIITAILFVLMATITGLIVGWRTHLDESNSIFGVVGLACVTPCLGNTKTKDYFNGNYNFGHGEVIEVIIGLDPLHDENEEGGGGHLRKLAEDHEGAYLQVDIVGDSSNETKWSGKFGPASQVREPFVKRINTDGWNNPGEDHVINTYSTSSPDTELSFTLNASTLSPLAEHSEIVAAVIMILVYVFILLEVIHRTLVAIFGSMIALGLFFIMHNGHTESVATIMLHLEWSTLGLLFGMMLIVGELSHTGVFEWCSVRLLASAKGSYNRLVVLLCVLTAVSSAFLDNVTTMLLVAPVTIDLCNILGVDPRPYLIGEILLSNVGGTATLIGDPPNIIIGASFEEIGFVDFIIYVAPCIFFLCLPATLVLMLFIYKPYFSAEKMPTPDMVALKKTYPIYDEPKLMIAGTVTFFVILLFFLHPVHHKDTAWIALLGAFVTIAFTNPHDVQDALRNHVEWDTLLFFAGLFVLVEVCAAMGLLRLIGNTLATYIASQPEESQEAIAITLILWVSAILSTVINNIPYTTTMIPVIQILADNLNTLELEPLAWALSLGACLGGNGTLLGASANIVTAGVASNKGYTISFVNFLYPGMLTTIVTVLLSNIYLLTVFVWTK